MVLDGPAWIADWFGPRLVLHRRSVWVTDAVGGGKALSRTILLGKGLISADDSAKVVPCIVRVAAHDTTKLASKQAKAHTAALIESNVALESK